MREQPAAPAAPLQRAADPVGRDDRLGGLLAGSVQRRAATGTPLLQRAIIAIDGPTDKAPARKITRNCLANLTQSGGRGAAAGPGAVKKIKAPKLAQNESLYVLGHGNTDEIGDLAPDALGDWILRWYGTRPYRGKIKLVACSSGIAPDLGAQSYAERLSDHLRDNATPKFHPASVDGVLGIAWVDEKLDKIVAIDDDAYDTGREARHGRRGRVRQGGSRGAQEGVEGHLRQAERPGLERAHRQAGGEGPVPHEPARPSASHALVVQARAEEAHPLHPLISAAAR